MEDVQRMEQTLPAPAPRSPTRASSTPDAGFAPAFPPAASETPPLPCRASPQQNWYLESSSARPGTGRPSTATLNLRGRFESSRSSRKTRSIRGRAAGRRSARLGRDPPMDESSRCARCRDPVCLDVRPTASNPVDHVGQVGDVEALHLKVAAGRDVDDAVAGPRDCRTPPWPAARSIRSRESGCESCSGHLQHACGRRSRTTSSARDPPRRSRPSASPPGVGHHVGPHVETVLLGLPRFDLVHLASLTSRAGHDRACCITKP